MEKSTEIRLVGSGGQGLILCAVILCAAVVFTVILLKKKKAAKRAAEEKPEETGEPAVSEDIGGLLWYSSPDGALVCFDGTRSLIALPVGDERILEGYEGHRRYVEGKEYIVYITKNGRIVH